MYNRSLARLNASRRGKRRFASFSRSREAPTPRSAATCARTTSRRRASIQSNSFSHRATSSDWMRISKTRFTRRKNSDMSTSTGGVIMRQAIDDASCGIPEPVWLGKLPSHPEHGFLPVTANRSSQSILLTITTEFGIPPVFETLPFEGRFTAV